MAAKTLATARPAKDAVPVNARERIFNETSLPAVRSASRYQTSLCLRSDRAITSAMAERLPASSSGETVCRVTFTL